MRPFDIMWHIVSICLVARIFCEKYVWNTEWVHTKKSKSRAKRRAQNLKFSSEAGEVVEDNTSDTTDSNINDIVSDIFGDKIVVKTDEGTT